MNKREFISKLQRVDDTKSTWQIWEDFITISAISLSNGYLSSTDADDLWKLREEEYKDTIKRYTQESQNKLAELIVDMVRLLDENLYKDMLGEIYMELNMGNKHSSQFFTPSHISELMSKILITKETMDEEIQKKGYITVCDPCCGGGSMLLAFIKHCVDLNIKYGDDVLVVAQDIDATVAKMCYIQLSLCGCAGYVTIGNSLVNPPSNGLAPKVDNIADVWFTPGYVLNPKWHIQRSKYLNGETPENKSIEELTKEPEPMTKEKTQAQDITINRQQRTKQDVKPLKKIDKDMKSGFDKFIKFLGTPTRK